MKKCITLILVLTILISLIPANIIEVKAEAIEKNLYEFNFRIFSDWGTGYTGQISITNNSGKAIENWSLAFDFDHKIDNFWTAHQLFHSQGRYIVRNAEWNADIQPGETLIIGIDGSPGGVKDIPSNFSFCTEEIAVEGIEYTAEYEATEDWQQASKGQITVNNIGNEDIEDWILEFDANFNIEQFWTADILSHEDSHYVVKNRGYNSIIRKDCNLVLGFEMRPGDLENQPSNFILKKLNAGVDSIIVSRQHEALNMMINELMKNQYPIFSSDQLKQSNEGYTLYQKGSDFEKHNQYKQAYEFYNQAQTLIEPLYKYLVDAIAKIQEISNNPDGDYDKDGLLNSFEINKFYNQINPLSPDSDENGISDADEDYDEDGLTNLEEQILGTDPMSADTDEDGLNDKLETELGLNPLLADSDGDGILDKEEKFKQEITEEFATDKSGETNIINNVTIDFEATGNAKSTTVIESVYDNSISTNVIGRISYPFDISTLATFDEAVVSFNYDEDMLGDINTEDLGVLWFDEQNKVYVLMDSTVDVANSKISFTTTHFSEYLLVNKKVWFDAWRKELNYGRENDNTGETQYYDIVLAIDSSGSMLSNDPNNLRKVAAKQFVDAFLPGDQGSIVDFDSSAIIKVHLTKNKDDIKGAIDTINSSGGTNIDIAVNKSIDELLSANAIEDNEKIIILLTDGQGTYNAGTTTKRAQNNNIKIFTIGLTSGVDEELLGNIAEKTGGKYYQISTSDDLLDVFERVQDDTIGGTDSTDTDGDGLSDILETTGFRAYTGEIIKTDPNNFDTDGDGLSDGEEIGQCTEYTLASNTSEMYNLPSYYYYNLYSNPKVADTDGDGLDDSQEKALGTNPYRKDTDGDGLTDYEEVMLIGTNPLKKDTDDDGLTDFEEKDGNITIPDTIIKEKERVQHVIKSNTTWRGIVHIYSPVLLDGANLFIEDGTKIIVHEFLDMPMMNRAIYAVNANIKTEKGTRIEFYESSENDLSWKWCAITIGNNTICDLDNVSIKGANIGINMTGESSEIIIENSLIEDCIKGVAAYCTSSKIKIDSTDFIINSDFGGVELYAADISRIDDSVQISHINIDGYSTGIYLGGCFASEDSGYAMLNYLDIRNANIGLCLNGSQAEIKNSYFVSNRQGIYGNTNATEFLTENCKFSNNYYGIYTCRQAILYCDINNNEFNNNVCDIKNSFFEEYSDLVKGILASLVPGAGVIEIISGVTGRDLLLGGKMGLGERLLSLLNLGEITDAKRLRTLYSKFKYADELTQLTTKFGNRIIAIASKYGDELAKAYIKYGDRIGPLLFKYKNAAAEAIIKCGDEAITLISKYEGPAAEAIACYGRKALYKISSNGDTAVKYYDNVLKLMAKSSDELLNAIIVSDKIDAERFDAILGKILKGELSDADIEKVVKRTHDYMSTNQKGDLGEAIADFVNRRNKADFVAWDCKLPSNTGFDNVFVKYADDGVTIEAVHICEAKYGSAQLGYIQNGTIKQMEDDWIEDVIGRMLDSGDEALVDMGRQLEKISLFDSSIIKKYLDKIDIHTGRVTTTLLE